MGKKVLVATDVMARGGVDRYTIDLVNMALGKGWEVEVMVEINSPSSIPSALASACPIYRGPIYHRRHPTQLINSFYSRFLAERKPDLVHLSCGIPWSCLHMREMTLTAQIPLLFTEHYVPSDLHLEEETVQRLIQIYRKSQGVIYVSEENLKNISRFFPASLLCPFYVIPNGIDPEEIEQKSPPVTKRIERLINRIARGEKMRFLSIGRFSAQKGIDLLIEALQDISFPWLLDIWGEGPEEEALRQLVADLHLEDHIQFYPWIDDLSTLFESYDLFLFPSRYEGLPFTLLEALASGIPIIASDLPVHHWMTRDGQYAHLFETGSSPALAEALEEWFLNPCCLAENRSSWIGEQFHREKNLMSTLNLWEEHV